MVKMVVQHILLPVVYRVYKQKTINERLLVFADAHHDTIPYSMEYLRGQLSGDDWEIREYFLDYQGHPFGRVLSDMLAFMKDYANARCVFICDNFLPVSSCTKRKETCVVQLWHAGGILKKYAYDTPDDIPKYYKGHVYKNYDITTVSAPVCVPVYERAMRLAKGTVYPIGLCRTDCFFDPGYHKKCRDAFYAGHPEAEGKRIILFAPTFRGKAASPHLVGEEWIESLERRLNEMRKEDEPAFKVYMRVHPHLDNKKKRSNIEIPTERLLPVIDVLISDVSSVIFDYVLLKKPLIKFIPDLDELAKTRGFYISLSDIPGRLVTNGEELAGAVLHAVREFSVEQMQGGNGEGMVKGEMQKQLQDFCRLYMGSCDGHSTQRLLKLTGLNKNGFGLESIG